MLKSKIQIPKPKFCHLSFVIGISFVICYLSFVILISGCATFTEGAKGIAGISTKALEENMQHALKQTFNYDYNACYNKAKGILMYMEAYIYAQKGDLIAIYVTEEDTTPVGIFFKEIDANSTQIEVTSASTSAKEYISKRLFAMMSGLPDPQAKKEEEKGQ